MSTSRAIETVSLIIATRTISAKKKASWSGKTQTTVNLQEIVKGRKVLHEAVCSQVVELVDRKRFARQ